MPFLREMLRLWQEKDPFDAVIANINRNILLNDMKQYMQHACTRDRAIYGGFYVDDIPIIRQEAEKNGFTFVHHQKRIGGQQVKFVL